jgi:hypothetical protein
MHFGCPELRRLARPNVRHERRPKAREASFWTSARWRGYAAPLVRASPCSPLCQHYRPCACAPTRHAGERSGAHDAGAPAPAWPTDQRLLPLAPSGGNARRVLRPMPADRAAQRMHTVRSVGLSWCLRGASPPANGRAARHRARASPFTKNGRCADCRRTGGPARRSRKGRAARHERCDDCEALPHAGPAHLRRITWLSTAAKLPKYDHSLPFIARNAYMKTSRSRYFLRPGLGARAPEPRCKACARASRSCPICRRPP